MVVRIHTGPLCDSGLIVREDPHVAAEGGGRPCLRRAEGRGCALRSCVRFGWRVGASCSGRCFTRLGNLSPTLIGTDEGSYRQLMGKRASVILSEREGGRDGAEQEVGGKVVAVPMQLISDNSIPSGKAQKLSLGPKLLIYSVVVPIGIIIRYNRFPLHGERGLLIG